MRSSVIKDKLFEINFLIIYKYIFKDDVSFMTDFIFHYEYYLFCCSKAINRPMDKSMEYTYTVHMINLLW